MRACLLGTELAHRAGLETAAQSDAFYAALMRFRAARPPRPRRPRRSAATMSSSGPAAIDATRTFDDTQILLFTVEQGRARTVGQFVGDPTAVSAVWS